MKKVYLLVAAFMFLMFRCNVYASSFSVTLDGESTFSDEVTVDVLVSNISGFTNGFYGLDAIVSYDKTKIELKSITKPDLFDLSHNTSTDRFVVLANEGLSNGSKLVTLTFKNKTLSVGESVTVSIGNMIGSDGEEDVPVNGTVTKTITLSENTNTYTPGDMNRDGDIGLQDVILLLRMYLGVDVPTAEDIQIGDMNNDGDLGLQDVISLLRVYLGVE